MRGDFALPAPITPDNYYNYYFTHYLRLGWDFLATPTILNHLTVGFNRVYTASKSPAVNGTDWPSTLGISGASGQTFPTFEFNGGQYSIGYSKIGGSAYTLQIPNALVVADSVSWTKGRHALQFGFDWRSYQFSVEKPGASSPHYYFEARETSFTPPSQDPNAVNAGDPMASFLLGLPDRGTLTTYSHFPRLAQNYYALYVQDDFKMRRNLTLNLGLRWDIETPRNESTGASIGAVFDCEQSAHPGTAWCTDLWQERNRRRHLLQELWPAHRLRMVALRELRRRWFEADTAFTTLRSPTLTSAIT